MPRDAILIDANDPAVYDLADRLWERERGNGPSVGGGRPPVECAISVDPGGEGDGTLAEERWAVGSDDAELSLGPALEARIECARGRLAARVSATLLRESPGLVARLLLETPVGAILARRAYGVVHAGAVAGPAGAVVIRGAPGAGKSTLVAAAHRAGLGVLADEAVLAARDDPDDLLAAVRDLTILADSTRLLGLDAVAPPTAHPPHKHRLDLFASSTPSARRGRRVAAILLGTRDGGPARLETLGPDEFLAEFAAGGIPQEQWSGTPARIAEHWSQRGAYRMTGMADLTGAVRLLWQLTATPGVMQA